MTISNDYERNNNRGMVLPLVMILAVLFGMMIFGMHTLQKNNMGLVGKTLNQQRALTLAEAGMQWAMARIVAKTWEERWYDEDGAVGGDGNFRGTFTSDPPDQDDDDDVVAPIDDNGRYDVFVQDRESEHTLGYSYGQRVAEAKVDHTEIFSVGTATGSGGETKVIIYARIAIVPEPFMYTVNSEPGVFKKPVVYREIYQKELVSLDVINDEDDRITIQTEVENELAAYAQNFQKNLALVKEIRDSPLNVPDETTFTKDEINSIFSGKPPLDETFFGIEDIVCRNRFADEMVRTYRVSDCLAPDENVRYELDQSVKDRANAGTAPPPAPNIRAVFFPDMDLYSIHDDYLEEPESFVDKGWKLIEYQTGDNTDSDKYQTDLASCIEYYFSASIPTGHTSETADGVVYYLDSAHANAFNGGSIAGYPGAMDADAIALGASPPDCYNPSYTEGYLPINLIITDDDGNDLPSIKVKEFLNFYLKYITSRADVSEDGLVIPPPPWEPPPPVEPPPPPPPPPPPTGGGGGGGGGTTPAPAPPPAPTGPPPASMGGIGGGGVGG